MEDLTGQKFGKLEVISFNRKDKNGRFWNCKCDCGNLCIKREYNLLHGVKSCGCLKGTPINDLTGERFGRLTVIERGENDKTGHLRWWVQCDCGSPKKLVNKDALLSGRTVSCGCYLREIYKQPKEIKPSIYNLDGDFGIGYTDKGEEFYFDIEDYEKIRRYHWWKDDNGYIVTQTKRKSILLHRLVMNACDQNVDVDHIYHDEYDARKENLRKCSHRENLSNRVLSKNNTSGHIGVRWDKRNQKWVSTISCNGRSYYLGAFKNIEDAIIARKTAEEKYFGEFAYKEKRGDK